MTQPQRLAPQAGGTLLGFVGGLLLGLALALVVALFVTRSAVPLEERGMQAPATTEAAEAERNRNWNPNANLSTRPATPAATEAAPAAPAPAAAAPTVPAPPAPAPADPLGQLIEQRQAAPAAAAATAPPTAADALHYFVQAGAFASAAEAQAQRARLAMLGFDANVNERRQDASVIYRVRLGPFSQAGEAEEVARRIQAQLSLIHI